MNEETTIIIKSGYKWCAYREVNSNEYVGHGKTERDALDDLLKKEAIHLLELQ